MKWTYRAADAAGRETRGDIAAPSAADAIATLRTRALWVIELHAEQAIATAPAPRSVPTGAAPWADRVAIRWAAWSGNDLAQLSVLTRSIATLLAAGVPVTKALGFAAARPTANSRWPSAFAAIERAVRDGQSLSEAVAANGALPVVFAPSLAAAEATGTLAHTFDALAALLERRVEVQARIRSALVYPAVLALSSIVGTLIILLVVVPRFAALVSDAGSQLPLSTRMLVSLSTWLSGGGWLLIPALVLLGVVAVRSLRDPARRLAFDGQRLVWPVIGAFERQREAARYLSTLSLALAAGVNLLRSMTLARATVHNRAYAVRLGNGEALVRDGGTLADAIGEELPPLARQLLAAGEASGALAILAQRAADAADADAERQLARLVSLIEPVMILGFGGIVGGVALALLQAIYGLNAGVL